MWRFISERLVVNEPVMLLCVVESSGSSPGRAGFKMAVTKNELFGSVGGGIMEHKFVELARERLSIRETKSLVRKQFHQKEVTKDQSGMICSGEQTLLLVQLEKENLTTVDRIIKSLENYLAGVLEIKNGEINFYETLNSEPIYYFEKTNDEKFIYREHTGIKNHLSIIGGGHCSLALSKLMNTLDFYIRVYEERNFLNTLDENSFAHEKIFVNNYNELTGLIKDGRGSYVVVMTFGYRTDNLAIRALIDKDFEYFGVLGSEAKMKKLFEEWVADGISPQHLQKISAPAGLSIKSETPEEIAVSIAAQMIQVKNKSRQ